MPLVAYGSLAEAYLDAGDRRNFANGGGAVTLHPDFAAGMRQAMSCARLVVAGGALSIVRRRLDERIGPVCRIAV